MDDLLHLEDFHGDGSVSIYPNPIINLVIVTGKNLKSAEVLNTLGQCVAKVQG